MPSQAQFDQTFLEMAQSIAVGLSKDPCTKVGCVIATPDNRRFSFGYNGFARGIKEDAVRWERPTKYEYVIHAELNALLNCPFDTAGTTLYCTHQPCHRCLQHVVNAGVTRVVFMHEYANMTHADIWAEAATLFDEVVQIKDGVTIRFGS